MKSNKPNRHVIKKQILNLRIEARREKAKEIQDRIIKLYKTKIGDKIDQIFSKIAPPDVHIQLDKIVLNLDRIKIENFEQEITRQIEKKLVAEVRKALAKKGARVRRSRKTGELRMVQANRFDIVESFLADGHLPPWANPDNPPVQEIFRDMLLEKPQTVVRLMMRYARSEAVRRRIMLQFEPNYIRAMLAILYGKKGKIVLDQVELIRRRLQRQYPAASPKRLESLVLGAALHFFVRNNKSGRLAKMTEKRFNQTVIAEVQENYDTPGIVIETEKARGLKASVRGDFAGSFQDLDVLEYFLKNGSMPAWADSPTKESLEQLFDALVERRLVPLQQMIERNIENPFFAQRLIFQFAEARLFQIFEPISSETIDFVEDLVKTGAIFSKSRARIARTASATELRTAVLGATLLYFFKQKKSNFVKQNALQVVVQALEPLLETSADLILEEIYEAVAERPAALQPVLEQLDIKLKTRQESSRAERQTLETQRQELEARIQALTLSLDEGTLPPAEIERIKRERTNLRRQLTNLERRQLALSPDDTGGVQQLRSELQALAARLESAAETTRTQLEQAVIEAQKRLEKRQTQLLREFKRLADQPRSAQQYVPLLRLGREVAALLEQLELDYAALETRIAELDRLIPNAKGNEKRRLRTQRTALQKDFDELRARLTDVRNTQTELQTTLEATPKPTMTTNKKDEAQEDGARKTSRIDYLLFVLEYGSAPWWAEEWRDTPLETLVLEMAQRDANSLRSAFARLGKNPVVWQRLVNQLSDEGLERMVQALVPSQVSFIVAQAQMLQSIKEARIFSGLHNVSAKEFKWSAVVETLLARLGAGFQREAFAQSVLASVTKGYNLAPSELIQYLYNLADSERSTEFAAYKPVLEQVANDTELQAIEKELVDVALRRRLQASGLLLNEVEKVELLKHFFETGEINEAAARAGFDTPRKMERLFAEQIDRNAPVMRDLVISVAQTPEMLQRLIRDLREETYWEMVQLIRPTVVVTAQNYFADMRQALGDKVLALEKAQLFEFMFDDRSRAFEPRDLVRFFIEKISDRTGRRLLAVVQDWKRKFAAVPTSAQKSSLYLNVLAIEVEMINAQIRTLESQEGELPKDNALKQQLQELVAEFSVENRKLYYFVQREDIEVKGVPEQAVALSELYNLLQTLREEFIRTDEELRALNPDEAPLQFVALVSRKAQLEAQIELLSRKEPALLRELRRETQQIEERIRAKREQLRAIETRHKRRRQRPAELPEGQAETPEKQPETPEKQPETPENNALVPLEETPETAPDKPREETPADWIELPEVPPAIEREQALVSEIERKADIFAQVEWLATRPQAVRPELVQRLQTELRALIRRNENAELVDMPALVELLEQVKALPASHPLRALLPELEPLEERLEETQMTEELLAEQMRQNVPAFRQLLRQHPEAQSWLEEIERQYAEIQRTLASAPIAELLQKWETAQALQDKLAQMVERDKTLKNNDKILDRLLDLDETQIATYRQIRRAQEKRRLQLLKAVQQTQTRLEAEILEAAESLPALEAVETALEQSEAETLEPLRAEIAATADAEAKTALESSLQRAEAVFEQLRRRLEWQRIRTARTLESQLQTELQAEEETQRTLNQTRDAFVAEIEQAEAEFRQALEKEQETQAQESAKKRKKQLPPPKPVDEPLYVRNAGLVLLWMYYPALFEQMGLMASRSAFKDEEAQFRAIHILQYVATKQTESPENELVLNKVMCGVAINTPIPMNVDLKPEELELAEQMIQAATSRWSRMKNMSPDSIRGSFLIRNGSLKEEADRWRLVVEKGSFDMLLQTVPWGFNFVRYGWMTKSLMVTWDYA